MKFHNIYSKGKIKYLSY